MPAWFGPIERFARPPCRAEVEFHIGTAPVRTHSKGTAHPVKISRAFGATGVPRWDGFVSGLPLAAVVDPVDVTMSTPITVRHVR
jgi:hypothetical protein